jgi:hypothetical protein
MSATWRSLGTFCREEGWPLRRVTHALDKGELRFRTYPSGGAINWNDPNLKVDLQTSEVTYVAGVLDTPGVVGLEGYTVGVEVQFPDAETEVAPAATPSPSAAPLPVRNVSEAALRAAVRAVVDNHPSGELPLDEERLWHAVEGQLGTQVARDRVLAARDEVAPQFKRRVGRPRKDEQ